MLEHGGRLYLTRKELVERGWRERDIIGHLNPVKTTNPERPKGCPMNLYPLLEVEQKEREEVTLRRINKDHRLASTIRWASRVPVRIRKDVSLYALAESIEEYDSKGLLAFFRHNLCNYENLMDLCDLRPYPREAKRIVRLRLLRLLAKNYFAFKEGAKLQWEDWYPNEETLSF